MPIELKPFKLGSEGLKNIQEGERILRFWRTEIDRVAKAGLDMSLQEERYIKLKQQIDSLKKLV